MPINKMLLIAGCVITSMSGCVSQPKESTLLFMLTGFAAKQTCSCLFVSQRPLASCKAEYDPTTFRSFSWQVAADSVTVSSGDGAVSHTARYEEGFGCHPVN